MRKTDAEDAAEGLRVLTKFADEAGGPSARALQEVVKDTGSAQGLGRPSRKLAGDLGDQAAADAVMKSMLRSMSDLVVTQADEASALGMRKMVATLTSPKLGKDFRVGLKAADDAGEIGTWTSSLAKVFAKSEGVSSEMMVNILNRKNVLDGIYRDNRTYTRFLDDLGELAGTPGLAKTIGKPLASTSLRALFGGMRGRVYEVYASARINRGEVLINGQTGRVVEMSKELPPVAALGQKRASDIDAVVELQDGTTSMVQMFSTTRTPMRKRNFAGWVARVLDLRDTVPELANTRAFLLTNQDEFSESILKIMDDDDYVGWLRRGTLSY